MNIRYRVELSEAERSELGSLLRGGQHAARKLKRAQILLAADAGVADETIAQSLGVGGSTVYRTKRHFVEGTLEEALHEEPRPGAKRKLTGQEEALLVATACSRPPEGRARWTIELLAGEMVRLTEHDSVSRETVRRRLAENELKPWREKMWCVPKIDGEYVARMEDVLDLYAEPLDPARPVVCLDESPLQLIGEVREPIPAAPGQLERVDYEYRRNGTVNLFVAVDAHRPWRKVTVTEQRTAQDYAKRLRELVDVDYPDAGCIRVVQDNLSTHTPGSLYEAFPAPEAHRILERLEFHYTPKHASWLNMVEIEIGVLKRQCLDRRIDDRDELEREIAAWERQRNLAGAHLKWMFTTEKARTKMGRAYPRPAATSTSPPKSHNHCAEELVLNSLFMGAPARIAELALEHRVPAMFGAREHTEAGGLLSYSPDRADLWRRAATYVDEVLKGADPAGMPVQQPTKFELVINLKTAQALGLTIPPTLLARADEVIE